MLFIISNSDGDTYVKMVEEETFLRDVENGYYGSNAYVLDAIPTDDVNYWPEGSILVIRGQIMKLRPKEKVISYELE
jgi:hypothetical protein